MLLPRIFVALAFVAQPVLLVEGYQKSAADLAEVLQPIQNLEPLFRQPSGGLGQSSSKGVKPEEEDGILHNVINFASHLLEWNPDGVKKGAAETNGVRMNSDKDTAALIGQLLSCTLLLFICIAIFIGLRKLVPAIYAHRVLAGDTGGEQVVPASHAGIFGWAQAALSVTDDEVVEAAGLDALMFLEFCRLFKRLMFVISPLAICVLCPLHLFSGKPPDDPNAWLGNLALSGDWLGGVGIGALIWGDRHVASWKYWVHAAMVWAIVSLTLWFTYRSHHLFLEQRFKWLGKIPEPRSTTLMVEGIPEEYRTDAKLKAYFTHLFTDDAIERAYVVRKTPRSLCKKMAQLEAKQYSLMLVEKQWDKDGRDPGKAPKVGSWTSFSHAGENAIEAYSKQVRALQVELSQERTTIEDAAATGDPSIVSSSGFVTFKSRRWCRHASREQYREDTSQWVVGMPPEPTDVIYSDLAKDAHAQAHGNTIATILIVLTFLVWTPLVALCSSLTSLHTLRTYAIFRPWLGRFLDHYTMVNSFLQGVLATFALNFLMSWLPTIFMVIIRQFWTLKSGAWAQLKLQNRFFIFQVTFVIFITTLGISVQHTLTDIVEKPSRILVLLAEKLPQASHFYLNYVLLGWFTVAMELLRAVQIVKYVFYTRCSHMDAERAREVSEPEDQDSCGMGARFGRVALIMTLAIVFSTVMPLITLFAAIYFYFCNVFYGYLLVFAETKKADLGGEFWIVSLRHILFALVLYVALMMGIMSSQGRSGRWPAVATAPVLLVLFLVWRRLGQFSWEILPFETLADMDHEFTKRKSIALPYKGLTGDSDTNVYVQPECQNFDNDISSLPESLGEGDSP